MLYQKLIMGNNPYFISIGKIRDFEIHRHPEVELSYCLKGEYDIICENKRYSLKKNDFAIISPMAAHEIQAKNDFGESITIEVGYAFLGEFLNSFTNQNFFCRLYRKKDLQHNTIYKELVNMLEETALIHRSNLPFGELSIKGNLYKISALLLQMLASFREDNTQIKKMSDVKKIDMALEKIYSNYYERLTVEEVSALCGYSKSNFCKIFKSITGDTFHNTLNRHRIELSCMLLRETTDTIEKIALETGFSDTKSFCRVFKQLMGKSAGEYRKNTSSTL